MTSLTDVSFSCRIYLKYHHLPSATPSQQQCEAYLVSFIAIVLQKVSRKFVWRVNGTPRLLRRLHERNFNGALQFL